MRSAWAGRCSTCCWRCRWARSAAVLIAGWALCASSRSPRSSCRRSSRFRAAVGARRPGRRGAGRRPARHVGAAADHARPAPAGLLAARRERARRRGVLAAAGLPAAALRSSAGALARRRARAARGRRSAIVAPIDYRWTNPRHRLLARRLARSCAPVRARRDARARARRRAHPAVRRRVARSLVDGLLGGASRPGGSGAGRTILGRCAAPALAIHAAVFVGLDARSRSLDLGADHARRTSGRPGSLLVLGVPLAIARLGRARRLRPGVAARQRLTRGLAIHDGRLGRLRAVPRAASGLLDGHGLLLAGLADPRARSIASVSTPRSCSARPAQRDARRAHRRARDDARRRGRPAGGRAAAHRARPARRRAGAARRARHEPRHGRAEARLRSRRRARAARGRAARARTRRSRSCATSRAESTRPCSPTAGSRRRSRRSPSRTPLARPRRGRRSTSGRRRPSRAPPTSSSPRRSRTPASTPHAEHVDIAVRRRRDALRRRDRRRRRRRRRSRTAAGLSGLARRVEALDGTLDGRRARPAARRRCGR